MVSGDTVAMSILDKAPVLNKCRDSSIGEHNFTKELDLKSKKRTRQLLEAGWKRCQNCGMLANVPRVKELMRKRRKHDED